ncbi:uronyl 2-sulfotransferase-like [Amphiura filiformis]|uniref:uronyl 2-sulfotransferase-like n=1 Tax=Amphiura filiformis TaxID=82378 RepID=UPI003B214D2E
MDLCVFLKIRFWTVFRLCFGIWVVCICMIVFYVNSMSLHTWIGMRQHITHVHGTVDQSTKDGEIQDSDIPNAVPSLKTAKKGSLSEGTDSFNIQLTQTGMSNVNPSRANYGVKVNGKEHLIVYNRVPKCGSRTFLSLLDYLKRKGRFTKPIDTWRMQNQISQRHTDLSNNKKLILIKGAITQLVKKKNASSLPAVIHGHFRFMPIDRSKQPVYINIIRDPLARIVSTYYFRRFGDGQISDRFIKKQLNTGILPEHLNMTFDECVLQELDECVSPVKLSTQISFFCGIYPACSEPSQWSLEQAKKHIEEEYLFVGINEDFESTVMVLERLAPDLFNGIVAEYMKPTADDTTTVTKSHKGPLPSKKVRAIMMTKLDLEYQLYNFVKNKLERLKNTLGITK